MIPSGIKPATFGFVAQHLNHCATERDRGSLIYGNLTFLFRKKTFSNTSNKKEKGGPSSF